MKGVGKSELTKGVIAYLRHFHDTNVLAVYHDYSLGASDWPLPVELMLQQLEARWAPRL